MKHLNIIKLSFLMALAQVVQPIHSQTIPVGKTIFEDAYRRAQLIGNTNEYVSMTVKPSFGDINPNLDFDTQKAFVIRFMPLSWKHQYNSDHPEGLNDGAMITARGYQTMLSGGLFAKYKFISVQFNPEFVYAENKNFQGFSDELPDSYWAKYYKDILKTIDIPERFGKNTYREAFLGQSSIRLNGKSISFGLSNENLWWGPGMQNALLMTNNAPGFMHVTLNTTKPIHTWLGSFEGQIIGGRLESSGYPGIDSVQLASHRVTYIQKKQDWRYINGMVLTYQPRWLPGLFLGVTRSFISYADDLGNDVTNYLPVVIPIFKKALGNTTEDAIQRDQLASLFFRWMAPKSHMEFYMEYGREDHSYDVTDFLLEPNHSMAIIAGFRKLTPINKHKDEFIDIQAEITQLGRDLSSSYRSYNSATGWYGHGLVLDGYTHNGQYLGAGIGTSSNMQSMSIGWVKGLKRIGLDFKRVAHDENFWAVTSKDYRTHWVDVGGGAFGEWDYINLLFSAKIQTIGSINYQHLYAPIPSDTPQWWDHGPIRYNVHAELGITYLFNR